MTCRGPDVPDMVGPAICIPDHPGTGARGAIECFDIY